MSAPRCVWQEKGVDHDALRHGAGVKSAAPRPYHVWTAAAQFSNLLAPAL